MKPELARPAALGGAVVMLLLLGLAPAALSEVGQNAPESCEARAIRFSNSPSPPGPSGSPARLPSASSAPLISTSGSTFTPASSDVAARPTSNSARQTEDPCATPIHPWTLGRGTSLRVGDSHRCHCYHDGNHGNRSLVNVSASVNVGPVSVNSSIIIERPLAFTVRAANRVNSGDLVYARGERTPPLTWAVTTSGYGATGQFVDPPLNSTPAPQMSGRSGFTLVYSYPAPAPSGAVFYNVQLTPIRSGVLLRATPPDDCPEEPLRNSGLDQNP